MVEQGDSICFGHSKKPLESETGVCGIHTRKIKNHIFGLFFYRRKIFVYFFYSCSKNLYEICSNDLTFRYMIVVFEEIRLVDLVLASNIEKT